LSRRGWSSPASVSGFGTHRDAITSRFGRSNRQAEGDDNGYGAYSTSRGYIMRAAHRVLRPKDLERGTALVRASAPSPSWHRPTLTEIYLCHAPLVLITGVRVETARVRCPTWSGASSPRPATTTTTPVGGPFPSWNRSVLTEIYLCHACSYQEILRTETARTESLLTRVRIFLGPEPPPPTATSSVAANQAAAVAGQQQQQQQQQQQLPGEQGVNGSTMARL
jgi:hypothetical protein